ncbi:glucose 1-dehydrogenase [candidate division KSB1 bacterium]|nr:glucose 1-dehydrogenase [candidate division KSB1 bacterium]NIR71793.1 glucose 1-dehydrogenase [candidate division KSB1 bacterium]NIS25775.1 glucose 1-dehydrogenase [candidate division KSB1 bacterium]NIU26465.1 glucose 1-dehydrogenase [candidate division KSB1 bacterium]NIU93041.1 glucose 1-dehydrogenase [candidate division KSB1 bacterium]
MVLKEKVALVTGASSGIGKATAILFAKEEARVSLLGRDVDALKKTQMEVANEQSRIIKADVSKRDECQKAIDETVKEFGQLDVLVNAAGIIGMGSIMDTSYEDWQEMMRINVDSTFHLMQLALPHLENTRGNVVNVSSVTGLRAFPNVLAYCVSKSAVDQLTRCTALELAPKGIRVNAVNPGVVVTNLHRRGGMDEEDYAAFLERSKEAHPLGRAGQPEEIAEAILYLASDRSEWVTGVTLSVDGGRQLTCAR